MSNEFNLLEVLDHQKMRPLKFDGLALCPEYGLHVGIEPVRGSSHVPGGHYSGTTVAARTRRLQLQTLDNVKLGSTWSMVLLLIGFLSRSVGSFSVIKQARHPTHHYNFSETDMRLSESLHTCVRRFSLV